MMILTSKFTNGNLSKNQQQHPSSHGIRDDMCYIIWYNINRIFLNFSQFNNEKKKFCFSEIFFSLFDLLSIQLLKEFHFMSKIYKKKFWNTHILQVQIKLRNKNKHLNFHLVKFATSNIKIQLSYMIYHWMLNYCRTYYSLLYQLQPFPTWNFKRKKFNFFIFFVIWFLFVFHLFEINSNINFWDKKKS